MNKEEIEKVKGIVERLYAGTGVTIGDILDTAPWLDKLVTEVEELQKENANKDKVIDLMAEHLFNVGKMPYRTNIFTKEELIQKYYEEVGDIE